MASRDAAIFDFGGRHTFTTKQLGQRFFTGRTLAAKAKKASRWIVRHRRRRELQVVCIVQRRDTGRPEIAYGRWCKQDQIEHEVRVTDFGNLFKEYPMARGVKVGRTEADGVIVIDGRTCEIEIDNSGKM